MANFINVSGITYSGEEYRNIYSKDIYDIDLRQYGITFMDGVKGKRKIYTGEIGDIWQLYTCPFTPAGSASLAEAYIEPAAIKANLENCYDTFWNTYLVSETEISLNGGVPRTFADWFFDEYRKKAAKEYQEIFWKGDEDYTGSTKTYLKAVDGIEKKLDENSGVTKVSGATITVDNVIAQVEATIMKGLEVANDAEVDTEGYKIFMNHADVRVLEVALGKVCCPNSVNQVFANYARQDGRIFVMGEVALGKVCCPNSVNQVFANYARQDGRIFVMGYEVVPTMQSKNTIIFGPARNLVLGFDTYDSVLQWKFIDMRETTGDNMFRVLAISNIAVGIILPELFVVSKP